MIYIYICFTCWYAIYDVYVLACISGWIWSWCHMSRTTTSWVPLWGEFSFKSCELFGTLTQNLISTSPDWLQIWINTSIAAIDKPPELRKRGEWRCFICPQTLHFLAASKTGLCWLWCSLDDHFHPFSISKILWANDKNLVEGWFVPTTWNVLFFPQFLTLSQKMEASFARFSPVFPAKVAGWQPAKRATNPAWQGCNPWCRGSSNGKRRRFWGQAGWEEEHIQSLFGCFQK